MSGDRRAKAPTRTPGTPRGEKLQRGPAAHVVERKLEGMESPEAREQQTGNA